MAHANRFSFDMKSTSLGLAVLLLAGCVNQSPLLLDGLRLTTHDTPVEVVPAKVPQTQVLDLKPSLAAQNPKVDINTKPIITPTAAAAEKRPAWCEYLQEDAAAQTTIMRSPTLSGSSTDDGKANISLGMSLTDYAKASLVEESAATRCRRYMAESGLQKLVFLSPQGLTSAGYRAKYETIHRSKKDIQALRKKVSQAMADGFLDREKATVLMGLADQLLAEAANAKSQADRRTGDFLGAKDHASLLGAALVRAEADLEDLNSRMRTFDNVDVSVSAGWSDDINRDNFAFDSEGFSGKVSMSIKLGAVAPSRFDHEQKAKDAKIRAIGEEGGAMWQVNVLRLAHERAIAGLEESRSKIDSAIAEANKLLTALDGVSSPEFKGTSYGAKFRVLQLRADKAAVDGSLAEIRTNLKRLKANG